MIPPAGSGRERIKPLPRPANRGEYPHLFYTRDETATQYHLAAKLSRYGEVYLEFSCGSSKRIDLVWVQNTHEVDRTVGIEIKRSDTSQTRIKIREQVEGYANTTVSDVNNAEFVFGVDQNISSATDTYLFDEVWVTYTGNKPDYISNNIGHGRLTFDTSSGNLAYEIDETPDRSTIELNSSRTESWYTAQLWKHLAHKYCLSTEIKASRPHNRMLREGEVKFKIGTTKKPDLVKGDPTTFDPVSLDSYIHAFEVKKSLDDKQRLHEQLALYCDSGMFSHVSLAVPERLLTDACELLQQRHPKVGLSYINDDGYVRKSKQAPEQLDLTSLPVVDTTNNNPSPYYLRQ